MPSTAAPTSDKALDESIRLAQSSGASLLLLHVVDELGYVNGFESAMNYVNEIVPLMREVGEQLLAHGRQKALDKDVAADSVLVLGGPGRVSEHVNEQARLANADLIVVGSHGRRGIGRVLLGSDAEQIGRRKAGGADRARLSALPNCSVAGRRDMAQSRATASR